MLLRFSWRTLLLALVLFMVPSVSTSQQSTGQAIIWGAGGGSSRQNVPNHHLVLDGLADQFDLRTHEGVCAYTNTAARRLHVMDPEFGHLRKDPGQNGCEGVFGRHAVDAVLYRAAGKTVDLVVDAGGPNARPSWRVNEGDNYPASRWFAPDTMVDPPVPPQPTPEPTPAPPVDLSPLLARLDALEAHVAALLLQMQAVVKEIPLLKARPLYVDCRSSIFGIPVTCELIREGQ